MNTRKGQEIFQIFQIILDSGFISTIIMGRLINKLTPKNNAAIQWNTQAGKIATNSKVIIYFTSPELITMMWECYVDDFTKGRYYMILERDLLSEL